MLIFLACLNGHIKICELLLNSGADYLLRNTNGQNAYDFGN